MTVKFRKISLSLAESFDAWRVIPRLILVAYSFLVFNLYLWYKSIPTYVQEKCDAAVLKMFIDAEIPILQAKELACSVIDVVGGPTGAQSTFVTTIIGLSTGIFGLYTATGRRWEGGLPADINIPPAPKPPSNNPHNDGRRDRRHKSDENNPPRVSEQPDDNGPVI